MASSSSAAANAAAAAASASPSSPSSWGQGGRSSSSGNSMVMMLPGPASRSNGGCSDCSPGGLLAYGAGSSVVVVADPRSMQLLCVLPMPSSSLASFVTSVRWSPHPLSSLASASDSEAHLRLAAGDRHGRIAIWDARSRLLLHWLNLDEARAGMTSSSSSSSGGIQDLCWIHHASGCLLASIHGPSLLCIWDPSSSRLLWMFDAAPEYLSCLRRDPFDARHLCALGLRGFLLSAIPLAASPADISLQEHRLPPLPGSAGELQRMEKEAAQAAASSSAPALAAFPLFAARLCFSPLWRHILFAAFPRELVAFDLHYGAALSVTPLPRGLAKFCDVMPDPDLDLLYCSHLDGRLSIWKRKE